MIQTEEKMLKAVGQFFYGDNFNELAFVVARGINGFKLDKRTLDGVDFKRQYNLFGG
ncbi:hypothetical protein P7H17_07565 [Paenibacillus larvae]|nr:hypothetical protein [Paenibacillus larvae]MDT2285983.1 hypothetical protein [Paenibacillus larvae]